MKEEERNRKAKGGKGGRKEVGAGGANEGMN